jgi:tetratricopeptide (TPR) repeat protein
MFRDCRDLETSAPGRAALEGYERALKLFNGLFADPLAAIDTTLADQPDFALGHALRANLMVTSSEQGAVPEIIAAVKAGRAAKPNPREAMHLDAAQAWAEGAFDAAAEAYGRIVDTFPRDLMALQVAHQVDFLTGRRAALHDRPAAALRAFDATTPGHGYVRGMLAFGLEENGFYLAAEDHGRAAVAAEPTDAWAIHAVAHVLETQGRADEGVQWLGQRSADWAPNNMLAFHNWWHLALYRLEHNDTEAALALYDTAIRPAPSAVAMELVDASAMLWRLHLRGVDVGDRWGELAEDWGAHAGNGFYAFNECHALLALLGARRHIEAKSVLTAMVKAANGTGTNAAMTRLVALRLAQGLVAFDHGAYAQAVEALAPLPAIAHRFGGSNAQRDLIQLTLLEAAIRAGDGSVARELAVRRVEAKPHSPFAQLLARRAGNVLPATAA